MVLELNVFTIMQVLRIPRGKLSGISRYVGSRKKASMPYVSCIVYVGVPLRGISRGFPENRLPLRITFIFLLYRDIARWPREIIGLKCFFVTGVPVSTRLCSTAGNTEGNTNGNTNKNTVGNRTDLRRIEAVLFL